MSPHDTLTPKQKAAVVALLSEKTVAQAAAKAGCSERTVLRWLKQPAFAQAVEQARQAVVQDGLNRLRTALGLAVSRLTDLMMNGGTEAIALRAALGLLDHGVKSIELCDVVTRLTALEQLMRKGVSP